MKVSVIDGFTVRTVDEGRDDYTDIWLRFRRGEIPCEYERLGNRRSTHILKVDGGRMVLKISSRPEKYWENKLSRLVHGPVYSRIMEKSNRAIDEGCTVLPRVYLVAERMERGLARESAMLIEYREGRPLSDFREWSAFTERIEKTMKELHARKIAFTDPNPGNFILDDAGGLSVIDLSFRDSFRMGRAKDALYLKKCYGIELESSLVDKFMIALVASNRWLRRFSRRIRGSAKKPA